MQSSLGFSPKPKPRSVPKENNISVYEIANVSSNLCHIENLTLLHSEWPKLYGVLNAIGLKTRVIVDPDKRAHHELPHLDLHCLQIQLPVFTFLVLVCKF